MALPPPIPGARHAIEGLNLVRAILDGTDGSFEVTAGTCIGMAHALINVLTGSAVREGITDPEGQARFVRDSLNAAEEHFAVYVFNREMDALGE